MALTYSFPNLEPVCCSLSSSNCCFLTYIQISQKACQVVLYSHLFINFPQFVVIPTVKCFGIVNKAKVDVFLELSCFFDDPMAVGNLISGSSAFSKSSLNIWNFTIHVLLKPGFENFEHYFTSVWDDCNYVVVWTFFGIALATHSSTLPWKIPWTEEPGRLQSMELQRVGHDWKTSLVQDWNENWPFTVLWPLLSFPDLLAYWVKHFNSIIY